MTASLYFFYQAVLCFISVTGIDHNDSPPINQVSDPIDVIRLFLSYPEQAQARLINHEFDMRIKESHGIIQNALFRLAITARFMYTNHVSITAARELQALHNEFQFDQMLISLYFGSIVS